MFYSAPHPTVSGLIVDKEEQHLILTLRKFEPLKGCWDTPGGFVDIGESLEEGFAREMREELNIEVKIERLLASYPDTYGPQGIPTINIFFVAMIRSGNLAAGSDVIKFKWFHRDRLPSNIAFENGRRAIKGWLAQSSQTKG